MKIKALLTSCLLLACTVGCAADSSDERDCISFEGKSISLPCSVGELGALSPDESSLFTSFGYTTGHLMYGDKIVGTVFLDADDSGKKLAKQTVVGLDFEPSDPSLSVEYMGISLNDTRAKTVGILGEPQQSDESSAKYLLDPDNELHYVSFSFSSDIVKEIALYVK